MHGQVVREEWEITPGALQGKSNNPYFNEEKREREKNTITEEQSKFHLLLNSNICQR